MGKLNDTTTKIIKDIDEGTIGKDEGFEKLYNLFFERLCYYIRGRSSFNRAEIEDIVQETFIRMCLFFDYHDRKHALSTWVYKVSGNLAKEKYRKKRRMISISESFKDEEIPLHPDDLRNPEKALIKEIHNEIIHKAIESLPVKYKKPFLLHEEQYLKYENIEKILNIPMGTVKSRINRAKILLAKKLEPYFPEYSNNRNDHGNFKKVKAI